mmetsp:Transcript_54613/g.132645  ORF Transcript_54613/g.132645 Transcript_54613/m.132645 type:complete len:85 (-) Transcript_54613:68-322(-)
MPWTVPSRKNGHVIQNMTGKNNNNIDDRMNKPVVYTSTSTSTLTVSEQEVGGFFESFTNLKSIHENVDSNEKVQEYQKQYHPKT